MIKKNFFYQSLYRTVLIIAPLIVAPYVSRALGPEGIGTNALSLAVASYFVLFAMLGIGYHGNRTIAAVRDDPDKLSKTFSNLLALHIAISGVVIVAYVMFIIFFTNDNRIYFIAQAPIVVAALINITWFFKGLENFKTVALRNVLVKTITVICVLIFVNDRSDLWKYILIMAVGTLMGQLSVWLLIRKFVTFVKPSWNEMKPHIRPMLILFIPILAMSIYTQFNRIMLGNMAGSVEIGFFSSSNKVMSIAMGFIWALNSVLIPRIANLNAKGDEKEKQKITQTSMKYIMMLAFAMAFGIAAIAHDFAPLFFGEAFEPAGILIFVLCIKLPILAFGTTLAAQYIIPHSKDKVYSASAIAAAVVSLVANMILIPSYGAMGAVVSMIGAESTRCVILTVASKKSLPIGTFLKNSIPFPIIGAAMFFLIRFVADFLEQNTLSLLIQIGIGATFFLGVSAAYLHVTKDAFFRKFIIGISSRRNNQNEKT